MTNIVIMGKHILYKNHYIIFDNSGWYNSRESNVSRDDHSQIDVRKALKLVYPVWSVCTWNLLELCSCIARVIIESLPWHLYFDSILLRFRLLTNARNEMRSCLQNRNCDCFSLRHSLSIQLRLGAAIKVDLETSAS